jgi:hypothetical protein
VIAEQQRLRAELIERYGEVTYKRALEMSGLRCCLQALARDQLSVDERVLAYRRANMHFAQLQASFMTLEQSAQITECAKRLDSAIDMWTLDEIEEREGLPPAP